MSFAWPWLCGAAEQDHGRLRGAPVGEERAEVGIGGNDDPNLGGGALEDLSLAGRLERVVADTHRVVPAAASCSRREPTVRLSIRNLNRQARAAAHAPEPPCSRASGERIVARALVRQAD